MSRRDEIEQVALDRQVVWLAGQMDEMEAMLTREIAACRTELEGIRKVLTGLLVSIVVALLSASIGLIAAATL